MCDATAEPLRPLVFAGGSGMLGVLGRLAQECRHLSVVVPVTDDGGSSGRIVDALGGPACGDLRNALECLGRGHGGVPDGVARFLTHRLPADAAAARAEWDELLAGRHPLWRGVQGDATELFANEAAQFLTGLGARLPPGFDYGSAAVGNMFLTGATLHLGSTTAGLFALARVWLLPVGHLVTPSCLVPLGTRLQLAARLQSGEVIVGQDRISHPSGGGGVVNKDHADPLPSRVSELFFVDAEGAEVQPGPSQALLHQLESCVRGLPQATDLIVYGRGSFFTSLLPSLLHDEVVELITRAAVPKVWIVNGSPDRETTYADGPPAAASAPARVLSVPQLLQHILRVAGVEEERCTRLVTHILVPRTGGGHKLDPGRLRADFPHVTVVRVPTVQQGGRIRYDDAALVAKLREIATGGQGARL